MKEAYLENLMTTDVACAAADTPVKDIVRTMREQNLSSIVIVEGRAPVGIITERDVVRFFARMMDEPDSVFGIAGDVMSTPPITVESKDSLFEAMVITHAQNLRHLPVVDPTGDLVGIVSQTDIAQAHFQAMEKQQEIIRRSVEEETRDLQNAYDQMRELSMQDPLLGIGNRRAMEVDLHYTHSLARRYRRPYTVILLDVDSFKQFNDHYGHPAGDQILRAVTDNLHGSIRETDRLYRYGGEEILVLLPDTTLEGASILADRMIESLRGLAIPHTKSPFNVVTMSGGVAGGVPTRLDTNSWRDVIERADQGLYEAKRNGRNQIATVAA